MVVIKVVGCLTEVKGVLNAEIPYHILKKLQNIVPHADNYNRLPRGRVSQLQGHTKGVNAVRWCPTQGEISPHFRTHLFVGSSIVSV